MKDKETQSKGFVTKSFLPSRRRDDFYLNAVVHSDTNVSHVLLKPPPHIKALSCGSSNFQSAAIILILHHPRMGGKSPTNLLLLEMLINSASPALKTWAKRRGERGRRGETGTLT